MERSENFTNEQRRERAYRALLSYDGRDEHDVEASAVDLVTDVLHMLTDYGMEPEDLLRIARNHYYTEVAEEREAVAV